MTSRLGLDGGSEPADIAAAKSVACDRDNEPPRSLASTHRPLVLGFGNILLGDDGAGVQLVKRLRSQVGADVANFIDAGTLSFGLLPYIEATASVLIIDAAELNDTPGTIALFEGLKMDQFLSSTHRRSVHEVGLIDLLDMARVRDCLPPRRALLCLQPSRIDWGEHLSSPVAAALPEAARQAVALLQRWKNN